TDGSSRLEERYSDTAGNGVGRLQSQKDLSGNLIRFEHDGSGHLTLITDEGSGQKLELIYTSASGALRVQQVNTYELGALGTPLKQVEYSYFPGGRLQAVKTVLNPGQAG